MTESSDPRTVARGLLAQGARVEVRIGFDRSWAPGFTVDDVADGGYRLQRRSDGVVLPGLFAFEDVRRERRNPMWWV